jgi:hypothetical protein
VVVTRYRCGACGNLTRFDVVTDRRTKAFHHYSIGGELSIEEEQVLSEQVVEVSCRWCDHGRAVEPIERDGAGPSSLIRRRRGLSAPADRSPGQGR